MSQRSLSVRQQSPRRRLWHVDYLHMQELVRGIADSTRYARGRLLDVGCGNRPYMSLFTEVQEYIGVDVNYETGNPQASAMAHALPFASASFDTVLSTQTLEHVEVPHCAVAEMARVLKPNGYLILTAPQTWRLHEKPYDFYRYTRFGLQYLFEQHDLEVVRIVPQGGVWATIGQMFNNAIHQRLRPRPPFYIAYLIYLTSNLLCGLLDRVWVDTDETINYLAIGRKRDAS